MRRYRLACFAILAVGLALISPDIGWWWTVLLAVGVAGFAVADQFVRTSAHPALWVAAAWGILPLLLADAVVNTGGAESPALMWFALPAVTLGARFEPRAMVLGAAYILVLLGIVTYGLDAATAAEHYQDVMAAAALVVCTVILSGALVESDRTHRRRSTVDPLTGLCNRSALEQRLVRARRSAEQRGRGPFARPAALRSRPLQGRERPARARRRRRRAAGRRLHDARHVACRRLDLPRRRRGDPRRAAGRRRGGGGSRSPSGYDTRCGIAARSASR